MAISVRASAAWAVVTADAVVTLPTHQAGDRIYIFAAWKAFDTTAQISGWTEVTEFADGSVAAAANVGSVKVGCWYKDAASSSESNPTLDWSVAPAPGAHCAITLQKGATDTWDTPTFVTAAIAAATTWSATSSSTIDIKDGAIVFELAGFRDDSATMTRSATTALEDDGSPNVTWNGNVVEDPATHASSTTSNDISADLIHRFVTTGANGVNLTATGTLSASETGACLWVHQGVTASAVAQLSAVCRATPARGVTTGINLVVGAAPGRATIARAAAAVLLTTVALGSAGRSTPSRGIADLTTQSGGTPVALAAIGRATPSRGVTQGISLVVGAAPGRATPASGAGTIVQTTALVSTGRATPAPGLADLSASGIADLAGSGRVTPARGIGGLTTRVALAGTERGTPAIGRGQLQMQGTTVSLNAIGRATPSRGLTTGITLVAGASPGRATPARDRAELSVIGGGTIVSLAGIGRDTPARGTIPGPLVIRIAIGAERSTPPRAAAQLTTDVALSAIGRMAPARGSAVLSFAGGDVVQLAATDRGTPVRGIATLRTAVALAGTGRTTTARGIASLRSTVALFSVGRPSPARSLSQLQLVPTTVQLTGIGRATPARGIGRAVLAHVVFGRIWQLQPSVPIVALRPSVAIRVLRPSLPITAFPPE